MDRTRPVNNPMKHAMNPTTPQNKRLVKGYGPAMSACSPLQRRFIEAAFNHPDRNHMDWLRVAGYKGNYEGTRKLASRMLHNQLVQDAMLEFGATIYRTKLPKVVDAIDRIIVDPLAKDHVKVLHGVLDRVGLHTVHETKTTVTHTFDRDTAIARIAAILERNQMRLPAPVVKDGDTVIAEAITVGEAPDSTD